MTRLDPPAEVRRIVATLEPGVIGTIKICNGQWCEMDFSGHVGWISQTQIWGAYPGETYKDYVKLTFAKGASLPDPSKLFNAGFGGGTRRAIDIHEGDSINARALRSLIKAAVAANAPAPKKKAARK